VPKNCIRHPQKKFFFSEVEDFAALGAYIIDYIRVLVSDVAYLMHAAHQKKLAVADVDSDRIRKVIKIEENSRAHFEGVGMKIGDVADPNAMQIGSKSGYSLQDIK